MSLIESFSRKTIFPPFFPSFYPYFSFLVITVFQFFFSFPMCLPLIFSLSLWTSRIISRKQTRMKHPGTLNFRWERSNLHERTRQAQFAHILKKRAGIRIQWLVTIFGILASIHNISLNSGQRFFQWRVLVLCWRAASVLSVFPFLLSPQLQCACYLSMHCASRHTS